MEWTTRSGNAKHRFKLGYRIPSGENNYNAVLKEEYYPVIATLYDSGVSQHLISKAFNVSQGTISRFIKGTHYKSGLLESGHAIELKEVDNG